MSNKIGSYALLRRRSIQTPSSIGVGFFLALKGALGYFSQLSVQPFLFGHKLQFLIEKSFFLGFADGLGLVSTRISAG